MAEGTFYHVVHAELPADAGHIVVVALVAHGGSSRDNSEMLGRQRREFSDEFVRDGFADPLLRGIAAEVDKRQYQQLCAPCRQRFRRVHRLGDRGQKAVAVFGQRLDEARTLGRVAQRLSQPGDDDVEVVIEIHEHFVAPEALAQFLARNHATGMLKQRDQHLKRLVTQLEFHPMLTELTRVQVNFEAVEADNVPHTPRS